VSALVYIAITRLIVVRAGRGGYPNSN